MVLQVTTTECFLELSISQLFQNRIFTPFNYMISCLFVLTNCDKFPQLLDVQRLCQLNTLLAVMILHFGKCSMCCFSCLLLGVGGIGFFLVSHLHDLEFAHLFLDVGVFMPMTIDCPQFMGRS